jgi:F0F1-type ATP synthase membrane subunit b/b'
MEMAVDIFKQLGANESLVHQFVIIVVMFYLTKFLFIDHLQKVLDTREDKTVNLEGSAEKQFEEIEKIQKEYKEKMQSVNKSLKEKTESSKNEIIKREEAKYRAQENEINTFIETSRKEIEAEINGKKDKVLEDAEQLAGGLVQKMTKGL